MPYPEKHYDRAEFAIQSILYEQETHDLVEYSWWIISILPQRIVLEVAERHGVHPLLILNPDYGRHVLRGMNDGLARMDV
jgi:hypothetical protein